MRSLANAFIFDVHDRIEHLPGSTEARKSLVQTALIYLENLRSEAGNDAGLSRELAAGYEKIGNVQGNPLRSNLGDSAGARQSYQRAIELLTPLAENGDRLAELQLLSVLDQTAILLRAQGEIEPALATWSRARDIGERLRAESPSDATTLTGLGNVYRISVTRSSRCAITRKRSGWPHSRWTSPNNCPDEIRLMPIT